MRWPFIKFLCFRRSLDRTSQNRTTTFLSRGENGCKLLVFDDSSPLMSPQTHLCFYHQHVCDGDGQKFKEVQRVKNVVTLVCCWFSESESVGVFAASSSGYTFSLIRLSHYFIRTEIMEGKETPPD